MTLKGSEWSRADRPGYQGDLGHTDLAQDDELEFHSSSTSPNRCLTSLFVARSINTLVSSLQSAISICQRPCF